MIIYCYMPCILHTLANFTTPLVAFIAGDLTACNDLVMARNKSFKRKEEKEVNYEGEVASTSKKKIFQCEFSRCSGKFARRSNMARHLQEVHGRTRFQCDECVKTYVRDYYLKRHMRKQHGKKMGRRAKMFVPLTTLEEVRVKTTMYVSDDTSDKKRRSVSLPPPSKTSLNETTDESSSDEVIDLSLKTCYKKGKGKGKGKSTEKRVAGPFSTKIPPPPDRYSKRVFVSPPPAHRGNEEQQVRVKRAHKKKKKEDAGSGASQTGEEKGDGERTTLEHKANTDEKVYMLKIKT